MKFFNIMAQAVAVLMPNGKSSMNLTFLQDPADAMKQVLRLETPGGGPTCVLTFAKAGNLQSFTWEGVEGARIDQPQADSLQLSPGQSAVTPDGRVVQAPGQLAGGAQRGKVNTTGTLQGGPESVPAGAPAVGAGDPVNAPFTGEETQQTPQTDSSPVAAENAAPTRRPRAG